MSGRGDAVVIGAGIAGLLAARVLADHFERVTVVERDRLPDGPELRAGVPQARHVHVLLLDGVRLLERLFPGLEAELATAAAVAVDWTSDVWLFNFGAWKPHVPSGRRSHLTSRALLEWIIRRRVSVIPNVAFSDLTDVTGLITDPSRGRVAGIAVRPRGGSGTDRTLDTDLVVNAAGRDSKAAAWLAAAGFAVPNETRVNAHLGYATRLYRPPAGLDAPWKALVVSATPPASQGAVLMPLDDERWIVTLAGSGEDQPPTDEAGFDAFLRALPTPLVADAVADAVPISSVIGYRRTENVLRDYAALPGKPDGFLSIGDAVCSLNPVYGQGMTVAARGAMALDACLREGTRGTNGGDELTHRFHRRLPKAFADPWLLATGEDLRYPATTGASPTLAMRLVRPYLDRVFAASRDDPDAYRTVVDVVHLLRPPLALFGPRVAASVLRSWLPG
jgi:2-polyprenyl-6-methoxyphenol hydroxylase-like FAD-dependent oxidoreductase